jgi:hypothetical protein
MKEKSDLVVAVVSGSALARLAKRNKQLVGNARQAKFIEIKLLFVHLH